MMKKLAIVVVLGLCMGAGARAHACLCSRSSAFEDSGAHGELVALALIKSYDQQQFRYMDIEVLAVLSGDEKQKTVRVYGDDGDSCAPYVTTFKIGRLYVLSLRGTRTKGHYSISNCGEYWLTVDKGRLLRPWHGRESGSRPPLTFAELARALCRGN